KQYVGCPMSFYFEKIAHYRREDDMNDWMDESVFGTIVHEVFEKLFGHLLEGHPEGAVVTESVLDTMRGNVAAIDREICLSINRHYRKLGDNSLEPLTGDTKLIGLIIKEQVREVLRKEKAMAPFTYLHGEWKARDRLVLNGSNGKSMTVNFHCIIDRVDFFTGDGSFPRLRIIDYKTGSDETSVTSLDHAFHDFKQKAFLQVMLYAQAYSQMNHYTDRAIQPMIYALKKLMVEPIKPMSGPKPENDEAIEFSELKRPATARSNKWKILDYRDYVTEFNDMLLPYLEELFDPAIPFKCADNDDACKYCAFTAICGRESKK
ncbi:MAG: PD-(D/E)XK nuclease family protein, partial [Muribaculaceae bacterium]|nr:PD-(D/E)XK nuclease family protein [Muribaculaceae bacterium]